MLFRSASSGLAVSVAAAALSAAGLTSTTSASTTTLKGAAAALNTFLTQPHGVSLTGTGTLTISVSQATGGLSDTQSGLIYVQNFSATPSPSLVLMPAQLYITPNSSSSLNFGNSVGLQGSGTQTLSLHTSAGALYPLSASGIIKTGSGTNTVSLTGTDRKSTRLNSSHT